MDQNSVLDFINKVEDWKKLPDKPLVTVLMSTFNHEKYIRQSLDGVLHQEVNFSYEILIKEDCSQDATREILESYQQAHPNKFRLWLTKENLYSQGIKVGLVKYARGKYIAKLEGDDYWTDPLKLQKQVDFLEGNEGFTFTFHYSSIMKDGLIIGIRPKKGSGVVLLSDLLFRKSYPTMSLLYRNSNYLVDTQILLKSKFTTLDFLLVLLLASKGTGYLFPDNMGVYRVHAGGIYSQLSEIKKLKIGIDNRRAALKYISMSIRDKMVCRLMIYLRQLKILLLKMGLKI